MGSCIITKSRIKLAKLDESIPSYSKQTEIEIIKENRNEENSPFNFYYLASIKNRISLSLITNDYEALSKRAETFSDDILAKISAFHPKSHFPMLKKFILKEPCEYMICKICDDILINPVHCLKCNLFICKSCYDETELICQHQKDEEENEYYTNIKSILNQENFVCFNYKSGCRKVLKYPDFKVDDMRICSNHEKGCNWNQVIKCTNPSCQFSGTIEECTEHFAICEFKQFRCFYCNDIFVGKKHRCPDIKEKARNNFLLPVRYCMCGDMLEWNTNLVNNTTANTNDEPIQNCCNSPICTENFWYKCRSCNLLVCSVHARPPICKMCGCGQKLKGGFIKVCSICKIEGGIGWHCNVCEVGFQVCEKCLFELSEVE